MTYLTVSEMITIGSCFAGIGGFELGLERSIPSSNTIWQIEREPFCQKVLRKHWPDSVIYDDITTINKTTLAPVDILCGGYPCQDLSLAGKRRGIHEGKKSSLYWEMWEIIRAIRPRVIVMENVASHLTMGFGDVLGSLAKIGYDAEWTIISAQQFGAPHLRRRLFIVAYPGKESDERGTSPNSNQNRIGTPDTILSRGTAVDVHARERATSNSNSIHELRTIQGGMLGARQNMPVYSRSQGCQSSGDDKTGEYWKKTPPPSPFCRVDDGVPNRVDRLRALGNAIVPQCSEWIGQQIWNSGLLQEIK